MVKQKKTNTARLLCETGNFFNVGGKVDLTRNGYTFSYRVDEEMIYVIMPSLGKFLYTSSPLNGRHMTSLLKC
jgi:hypothetical protein